MQIVKANNPENLIANFAAQIDTTSKRTKANYTKAAGYCLAWLAANVQQAPTRADAIAYKNYLLEHYATATASAYLTAARQLFFYLEAEGISPNIFAAVKNPKQSKQRAKDALSAEQIAAMLEGMPTESLANKRDFAIMSLLSFTGLRVIEIARADIKDLRMVDGADVLFIQGKGRESKDNFVKLAAQPSKAIKDYLQARKAAGFDMRADAPLFAGIGNRNTNGRLDVRSVSRIAKETLKAAGFDDARITAHSLRHSAVTIALQAGAPMRDVQLMARHASSTTTERYAHDTHRIKNAAEDYVARAIVTTTTTTSTEEVQAIKARLEDIQVELIAKLNGLNALTSAI